MKNMINVVRICLLTGMLFVLGAGCGDSKQETKVAKSDQNASKRDVTVPTIYAAPNDSSIKIRRKREFVGSSSCIGCHDRFYKLWSSSRHGLAMQSVTPEFVKKELISTDKVVTVGKSQFSVVLGEDGNKMIETIDGKKVKEFPMVHATGGKNVYFFLTPLEKGRLQVMPLGYDVRCKEWYNTTKSMVRMALGDDEELKWTDSMLTFNTSCYNCHISQLQTNYSAGDGSYHTTWKEPGINCETCHGPASEHVHLFREAIKTGTEPKELGLISTKIFTHKQHNSSCSSCHAKAGRIWKTYEPGAPFYDYYEPAVLDDRDYYPDGRDLGENYTYTSWSMSPCVKSGQMSCIHCHTSSGRYRFAEKNKNFACMPCHEEKVNNPTAHTHHRKESKGSLCISCHMPMTEFSRMKRSDHSMRPPMPSATMEFGSPNACNICHESQTPKWADKHVREWRKRDYQKPVIEMGRLIQAARNNDWSKATEIFEYLKKEGRDETFAASFIRMLPGCNDQRKWKAIEACMTDPSPLVRSAAAVELRGSPHRSSLDLQLKALRDKVRLVRIRAAYSLADLPRQMLNQEDQKVLDTVSDELEESYKVQTDSWSSHYSLANYYAARGWLEKAIKSYEASMKLRTDVIAPMVNAANIYSRLNRNDDAEKVLRKAIEVEPNAAGAHFNLGLLLAQTGDREGAIKHLKRVIELDSMHVQAAYNLGVLLIQGKDTEGLKYLKSAADIAPDNGRYGYSYAFYLAQLGDKAEAMEYLRGMLSKTPDNLQVVYFYTQLLNEAGRVEEAITLLQNTSVLQTIQQRDRDQMMQYMQQLQQTK